MEFAVESNTQYLGENFYENASSIRFNSFYRCNNDISIYYVDKMFAVASHSYDESILRNLKPNKWCE